MSDGHVCQEHRCCSCNISGLEPNEDCDIHGFGPHQPRCSCGKFVKVNKEMLVEATLVGGEKILAHPPEKCEGQHCCVHNPSDHHMKRWRQHWRNDTGVMERICEHGIGHPDFDHLSSVDPDQRKLDAIHGCCLCCNPVLAGDEVARQKALNGQ